MLASLKVCFVLLKLLQNCLVHFLDLLNLLAFLFLKLTMYVTSISPRHDDHETCHHCELVNEIANACAAACNIDETF